LVESSSQSIIKTLSPRVNKSTSQFLNTYSQQSTAIKSQPTFTNIKVKEIARQQHDVEEEDPSLLSRAVGWLLYG